MMFLFLAGLRQYLVLVADEEIAEEEAEISDLSRVEDDEDCSTTSSEDSDSASGSSSSEVRMQRREW